ncbi:MAG TPA: DUF2851 family protein [Pseudobacter sp.]|nr:DUF2851 family protein [Pseudobacter sp.]
MQERLLQFIWQFRYFNFHQLSLTNGMKLEVLHPGILNHHQGPDFQQAHIRIDGIIWVGQVELHIRSSDWFAHAHHRDALYRNVILHVVWEDDIGNHADPVPVLPLQDRVPKFLLNRYEAWMRSRQFIPCQSELHKVNGLVLTAWKERLLVERLQRKTAMVFSFHNSTRHHWEETFWWMLARNFGMKVNADAFESIARTLPGNLLLRHRNNLMQLEALLLGQANLLDEQFREEYPRLLKREYEFYRTKYGLRSTHMPVYFLRMRPPAFPTIRLAQLAMLLHTTEHLFQQVLETEKPETVRLLLNVTASAFWDEHYTLEEKAPPKPKHLGEQFADNIMLNTIIPVLFAYGCWKREQQYKDRAIQWLQHLPAEQNSILSKFRLMGTTISTAFESQALLELKTQYCDRKRCLDCAVGNSLISLQWPPS